MKYLTKRQRKRKKVQVLNKIGQSFYKSDTEGESETEIEDRGQLAAISVNKKKSTPTKVIAKGSFKTRLQQQQQQQQQHQQQQQQQHDGPATTKCDNRHMQFGPADRDLDRYYHRNVPLTLGNFMDLEKLNENQAKPQGQRLKSTNSSTKSQESNVPEDQRTSENRLETADQQRMDQNQDVSINELLTRFAINTPYKELADLTFAMLQNTAFGALATGTSSTDNNRSSSEFWPNPYQISLPNNSQSSAQVGGLPSDALPESTLKPIGYEAKQQQQQQRQQSHSSNTSPLVVNQQQQFGPDTLGLQRLHINNTCPMEAKQPQQQWLLHQQCHNKHNTNTCPFYAKQQQQQQQHQHQQLDPRPDMWQQHHQCHNKQNSSTLPICIKQQQQQQIQQDADLWLQQQQSRNASPMDANPNSIVESIKCIWKRNNNSCDNWAQHSSDSNNQNDIWNTTLSQQHQQLEQQLGESSWDQRSRAVLAASQQYDCFTPAPMGQQQQQESVAANSNYSMRSDNSMRYTNRSSGYFNAHDINNWWQEQQEQQEQQQQQQQQELQQQHLNYNYQNPSQQQLQPQQQQHQLQQQQQLWHWQQYRPPRPRQTSNPNRLFKCNANNSNVPRKSCKHCCCNARHNYNNPNMNCTNMDLLMLNMSQEDLDAAQMYAIHGERFFEMPMGRRYKRTLCPPVASTMPSSAPATAPPPPPLPPPPPCVTYRSNEHINNTWQSATVPTYPVTLDTPTPAVSAQFSPPSPPRQPPTALAQGQMTAPVSNDIKLYSTHFPPLPTPNQKRGSQNQKGDKSE